MRDSEAIDELDNAPSTDSLMGSGTCRVVVAVVEGLLKTLFIRLSPLEINKIPLS